jgi:16S rRNA (guanine966-N2)-methyltransferase
VRIIAGSCRGRRIAAPPGIATRPTGDRVREALFGIVGPVDDATVLDLYAGSGALGLEALSRGARRCTFVDDDRAACRAIRENVERLGLVGAVVDCRDALASLRELRARRRLHDLVLVDPPYGEWSALAPALAELLPPVLDADGVLVVESGVRVEPTLPLDLVTSRRYGSARVTIFRHP